MNQKEADLPRAVQNQQPPSKPAWLETMAQTGASRGANVEPCTRLERRVGRQTGLQGRTGP